MLPETNATRIIPSIQPVEFPMVLDLFDLCAEDLKATLKEHRNILTEREDLRLQNRHGIKGKVSTSTIALRTLAFFAFTSPLLTFERWSGFNPW
jgi:hypothetical protein